MAALIVILVLLGLAALALTKLGAGVSRSDGFGAGGTDAGLGGGFVNGGTAGRGADRHRGYRGGGRPDDAG